MKRRGRWLACFIFIAVFFFPENTDRDFLTSQLESVLAKTLGYPVRIGRLEIQGVQRVMLYEVEVNVRNYRPPVLAKIHAMSVEFKVNELLKQHIRKIEIDTPELNLSSTRLEKIKERFQPDVAIDAAQERFNLTDEQVANIGKKVQIDDIVIRNAKLTYSHKKQTYVAKDFNLHVGGLSDQGLDAIDTAVNLALEERPAGSVRYIAKDIVFKDRRFGPSKLEVHDVDLNTVIDGIEPYLPESLQGDEVKGRFDLTVVSTSSEQGVEVTWKIADLAIDGRSGEAALAKFAGNGELRVTRAENLTFESQARIRMGQVLWGSTFTDFKGMSVELAGDGDYQFNAKSSVDLLEFNKVQVILAGLVNINAKGTVKNIRTSHKEADFSGRLRVSGLEGLPHLAALAGASELQGAVDLPFDLQLSDARFAAKGRLNLDRVSVRSESFSTDLMSAKIPFAIERKGKRYAMSAPGEMQASWKMLQVKALTLGPAEVRAVLKANRLSLMRPVTFDMFGGKAEIVRLSVEDFRRPLEDFQGQIRLKGVALYPLTQHLGIFPFFGEVNGDLTDVRAVKGEVSTQGSIQARLFQGELNVDRLWARNLASPERAVGMDMRFSRINLGLLSSITNFGYINGVLEGSILGLVVYRGGPVAFDADIYTVPAPGVDYRVGIQAVRNITIFAGAAPVLKFLDRGIYRFIDTYNYEALGFKAHLERGILRMEAKLTDGKRDLFLKGRGLPRIDVVLQKGGREVVFEAIVNQFKEVKLRLKREKSS